MYARNYNHVYNDHLHNVKYSAGKGGLPAFTIKPYKSGGHQAHVIVATFKHSMAVSPILIINSKTIRNIH